MTTVRETTSMKLDKHTNEETKSVMKDILANKNIDKLDLNELNIK